jgi:hypothetical protein
MARGTAALYSPATPGPPRTEFRTYILREKVIDMSEKAEKIKKMLEMQKKFIEYEQKNGVDPKDYFSPDSGHDLDGYRQEYMKLAMEVVDMAHAEKGSHRN